MQEEVEVLDLVEQHELQRAEAAHVHLAVLAHDAERAADRLRVEHLVGQLVEQALRERRRGRLGAAAAAADGEARLHVDDRAQHAARLGEAVRDLGVLVQAEEADGVVERQSVDVGAVVVERATRPGSGTPRSSASASPPAEEPSSE